MGKKVEGWLKNPYALVKEIVDKLADTLRDLVSTLGDELDANFEKAKLNKIIFSFLVFGIDFSNQIKNLFTNL